MRTVPVSGVYYRVADPDWPDPLDPSYAAAASGQRWNPPGLACLYLSCDETTAHANVTRLFFGLPYGPEDLDPATAPLLLTVELPNGDAADAFTDQGVVELGLPRTYPKDANGDAVPHTTCQPIGQAIFDAGLDGVDCRSAVSAGQRELAWFPRTSRAHELSRRGFEKWW